MAWGGGVIIFQYVAIGEWRMANGEWRMENGEWRMENWCE